MEHKGDGETIVIGALGTVTKGKVTGRLRSQRTSGDHPNNSIIKIGQNTEKNPEDLRRHVVIQTLVKTPQPTLV